jgi:hypothetical protein
VSRLIALCRGLLLVEVPRALCDEDHLTLSLELETPFVACGAVPGVEVNAIPFWDSRAASYPPPSDVIQTVFEGRDRSLHRLSVVGPDSATPWCITKAFPSLRPEHSLERAGSITDSVSAWTYSLHLVEREPGFRARPGVLAIRIDEKVRQELDARQEHLAATYRTTTGSRANGIATGTRFNVVDPLRKIGHVTARLLTPSWGGSDGMMGQGNADGVGPALGAARDRGVRTVGDFQLILESHFDDELELVTPRELVRVHPESFGSVLCVRLRFRHALRTRRERTIILFACQHFFKRYLGSQCPDGLVFHDVDDEEAT